MRSISGPLQMLLVGCLSLSLLFQKQPRIPDTSRRMWHDDETRGHAGAVYDQLAHPSSLKAFPAQETNPNERFSSSFSAPRTSGSMVKPQRQRPSPTQDCLVAFHIPKTGGTTLRSVLTETAKELNWTLFWWPFEHNSRKTPLEQYEEYGYDLQEQPFTRKAIHNGHILPAFMELTNTSTCKIMTVLREPVDRVISLFYYQHHRDDEWSDCLFKMGAENPCGKKQVRFGNDMTRFLSGAQQEGRWENRGATYTIQDRNIERKDFKKAKQLLMDMDLVCFTDEFLDCARRIRSMLHLPQPEEVQVKRENARGMLNRPKMSDKAMGDLRRDIASANLYDVQLYEWARETFYRGASGF